MTPVMTKYISVKDRSFLVRILACVTNARQNTKCLLETVMHLSKYCAQMFVLKYLVNKREDAVKYLPSGIMSYNKHLTSVEIFLAALCTPRQSQRNRGRFFVAD